MHQSIATPRSRRWLRRGAALLLCLSAPLLHADERWQRLDGFLQASTAPGQFPGAVALVEHDGRIVFQQHYGHADSAGHRPLQADSIFRIYSMTKPVTSVAVLMLLEEGKLSLD
ncbi:MAG: serine hydrolase, partial [Stenotrophomonas sp.]